MSRLATLFTAVALMLPAPAFATVCTPTTLNVYMSYGATGCDIGTLNLSNFNFSILSSSGGPTPLAAADITVTPSYTNQFSLNFTPTSGPGFSVVGAQSIKYLIEYLIDPPPPVLPDMELRMLAFSPVAPGFAQVTADLCVGSAFVGAACNLPGVLHTLTVNHNGITFNSTDSTTFPATYIIGVRNTIELDGNGASADFTSFETSSTVLPEPSTALLLAAGCTLMIAPRLRRKLRQVRFDLFLDR